MQASSAAGSNVVVSSLLVKSMLFVHASTRMACKSVRRCTDRLNLVAHIALVALTLTLVALSALVAMNAFAWMTHQNKYIQVSRAYLTRN